MYVAVGHHRRVDQSIAVEGVEEVCITFFKNDVVVLPLELLCRPLVHIVNISERAPLCLPDVTFLCPTRFFSEVRSTKDHPNFVWGFYFRSIIL